MFKKHRMKKDARIVTRMFDAIAPRYDFLNRLLSFRRDVAWRNRMKRYLPHHKQQLDLLDVATGTGDVLLMLAKSSRIQSAIGVDMAENMLALGRTKLGSTDVAIPVELRLGDACALPFANHTFDVVTIAFGIRNVENPLSALQEMTRVLRPGGRLIVLEFSMPKSKLMKLFYLLYFRYVLPVVGGLVSQNRSAYRYLNQSVEAFPSGKSFVDLMQQAGLQAVRIKHLTYGVASIYWGDRP